MPASAPAVIPHKMPDSGPRKAARFNEIISERINDNPKILPLLNCLMVSSDSLFSFIHAPAKSRGEYHKPPIIKNDTAATSTARKLIWDNSIGFNL